jgi:hypothetical protein
MKTTPAVIRAAFVNRLYYRSTADFTAEEHYATDAQGRVFTRMRCRGPYGYQNSAWRLTQLAVVPSDAHYTARVCRLPRLD